MGPAVHLILLTRPHIAATARRGEATLPRTSAKSVLWINHLGAS